MIISPRLCSLRSKRKKFKKRKTGLQHSSREIVKKSMFRIFSKKQLKWRRNYSLNCVQGAEGRYMKAQPKNKRSLRSIKTSFILWKSRNTTTSTSFTRRLLNNNKSFLSLEKILESMFSMVTQESICSWSSLSSEQAFFQIQFKDQLKMLYFLLEGK